MNPLTILATMLIAASAPPPSPSAAPAVLAAKESDARPSPPSPSVEEVALGLRETLAASLRWHGVDDEAVYRLGAAVESIVLAANAVDLPADKRRRATDDFAAWLGSPWWRLPPRSLAGTTDADFLASTESLLRPALDRWLMAPAVSETDRTACLAEEQAMLAVLLESIEAIARDRRLDEACVDRWRQRVLAQAEVRRSRRGNPFFPEWSRPRPIGPASLGERLAAAVRGDGLLRAIAERASIELRALEQDPRTARFRRLLVDSQIDAAANRLEEIAARTLDEADPDGPPRADPPPRSPLTSARPEGVSSPDATDRRFDTFVEELLAGAPPGTSR